MSEEETQQQSEWPARLTNIKRREEAATLKTEREQNRFNGERSWRKSVPWTFAEWGLWGTQRTVDRANEQVRRINESAAAKVVTDRRHARLAKTERYKMIAECRKSPVKPAKPITFCDDPHCDHKHK